MPATNAVLHDKRYSADGIFCEPPKKLDAAAAAAPAQNSQSQWNTTDYHWEERDATDFARQAISDRLLNDRTIWSDANGNILEITAVELTGDAASNVRKGKRILTYSLKLKVTCEGCRNGARLRGVLESVEFCHDDDAREVVVNLATEPMESDAGVEVNRAMKAHEMFARVLKKKALPRVASLGNPKHARHAPLHPHDVDAFLAGAAPRRPLAPNVNVYRVAVPF